MIISDKRIWYDMDLIWYFAFHIGFTMASPKATMKKETPCVIELDTDDEKVPPKARKRTILFRCCLVGRWDETAQPFYLQVYWKAKVPNLGHVMAAFSSEPWEGKDSYHLRPTKTGCCDLRASPSIDLSIVLPCAGA